MKTKYRFIGLIGSLVCFGVGGNAYADAELTPDELQGNPPAILEPELQDILPHFGPEFAMKYVPPAPGIDFKIANVTPDPSIDYKIKIISSKSQECFVGSNDLKKRFFHKGNR